MAIQAQLSEIAQGLRMTPEIATTGLATVLLEHVMPDGNRHFDWMIQRGDVDSRPNQKDVPGLVCFRIATRLDRLRKGEIALLERIADHRTAYLEYEGPVSGDRGSVERLARGIVDHTSLADDGMTISVTIVWMDDANRRKPQKLRLKPKDSSHWTATDVTM